MACQLVQLAKNPVCQCRRQRRCWFYSSVREIPWRRKWQLTPVLAWEIPLIEKPGRLKSMGLKRIGHDWACMCAHACVCTHTTHTHTLGRKGNEDLHPEFQSTPPTSCLSSGSLNLEFCLQAVMSLSHHYVHLANTLPSTVWAEISAVTLKQAGVVMCSVNQCQGTCQIELSNL